MSKQHHFHRPAENSARRAFVRLSVPIAPNASPRAILEAQAAFLIDLLDQLQPDPDLEENGDLEPSLAGSTGFEVDAEGDDSDDEPSLGSLDGAIDQRRWNECEAWHGCQDRELDRSDHEPSLGWANPLGLRFQDGQAGSDRVVRSVILRLRPERVPIKRVRRPEVRP